MSALSQPRVSVLIAAYNPRYLRAALNSVAAQSFRDVEIIICDDCRSDAVTAIVQSFTAQCALPVRYAHNETQLGVRRNYERCFESARGKYIKFLNDDDLLDVPCIERLVCALDCNPGAHLASSHRRRIDALGSPLRDVPATLPFVVTDCLIEGKSLINALLLLGLNFVGEPSTALFRRSAIAPDEPLFEFLGAPGRGVSDFVLWCKLALKGDVAFLTDRLSSFRIHGEQRQAITEIRNLAAHAIPIMRERWLALDHYLSLPPNVLRVASLVSPADTGSMVMPAPSEPPWQLTTVPVFTPTGAKPQQLVDEWRARRHPFFSGTRATQISGQHVT